MRLLLLRHLPQVGDFGLAHLLIASDLSQTADTWGSVAYMVGRAAPQGGGVVSHVSVGVHAWWG